VPKVLRRTSVEDRSVQKNEEQPKRKASSDAVKPAAPREGDALDRENPDDVLKIVDPRSGP
jgi:hypothetical protein